MSLAESQKEGQSLGGAGGDRESGGVRDLSAPTQRWVKLWDKGRLRGSSHLALCPAGIPERLGGRVAVSWSELISCSFRCVA